MIKILKWIQDIIFTIITLGLKDKAEKLQLQKDKESLIIGISKIINEGEYVYGKLHDGVDFEDLKEFADPERLKTILENVQNTYKTTDRIRATISSLLKAKKIIKGD